MSVFVGIFRTEEGKSYFVCHVCHRCVMGWCVCYGVTQNRKRTAAGATAKRLDRTTLQGTSECATRDPRAAQEEQHSEFAEGECSHRKANDASHEWRCSVRPPGQSAEPGIGFVSVVVVNVFAIKRGINKYPSHSVPAERAFSEVSRQTLDASFRISGCE